MAGHGNNTRKKQGHQVPRGLVYTAAILVTLSLVPFAVVALMRATTSTKPPIHIFLDMDNQPKLLAQEQDTTFADHRAMRPEVEGTVARGELKADDHYYRGYYTNAQGEPVIEEVDGQQQVRFYEGYPEQVEVTEQFVMRGRERYNIYCAPCHGQSGQGTGMVHLRAMEIGAAQTGWVQPINLVQTNPEGQSVYGPELYPNGKLFRVISEGVRTMSGYASQISERDRWAIIAYVRALQLSQNADPEQDVPQHRRDDLEQQNMAEATP